MPSKIKPRRSYTANSVPLTTDLETHELAINWVDFKAFTKDAAGNVVSVTLGGTGGGGSVASAVRTYTVTNSGSGAYLIDGASNPTLTLERGQTYDLTINAAGHPFHFQAVAPPYSSGNLYTTGVTNSGTASGTIRIVVPYNAPATLYYVCELHSSMGGTVNIVNANEDAVLRALLVPPAPTGVTATAGNAQAVVTWTAPTVLAQTPITDYTVQFSSNSGSTWTTFVETTIAIGTQPSNQTAASGNATFSVTATVSPSGTATYQWQKSDDGGTTFSAVSGATSATLSLTSLTNGSDNNDRYRVVVSAVGATPVTSSAATLTVAAAAVPVTFAGIYSLGSGSYSVTGSSTVTASLTGATDGRLWLLINTTGTLTYTVTASSEPVYDGGRLYLRATATTPAQHNYLPAYPDTSISGFTNVSAAVTGTQVSTGTIAVTAGHYLMLRYTKDEESVGTDSITAVLSIA